MTDALRALLTQLSRTEATFRPDGARLAVSPKGVLQEDQRQAVQAIKDELVALLEGETLTAFDLWLAYVATDTDLGDPTRWAAINATVAEWNQAAGARWEAICKRKGWTL